MNTLFRRLLHLVFQRVGILIAAGLALGLREG
jgi:hypothetical protein